MKIKERESLIKGVIQLAQEIGLNLDNENIFQINLNAKAENLKIILTEIKSKEEIKDKLRLFKNLAASYLCLKLKEESEKENPIWKKDEINALQKAVKKLPAGTKDRWEKIGEFVKTKSINQIIQMAHYLTTNPNIKIENDIDINNLINRTQKEDKK